MTLPVLDDAWASRALRTASEEAALRKHLRAVERIRHKQARTMDRLVEITRRMMERRP